MNHKLTILFLLFLNISYAQQVSLAGQWRFQTDEQDKGVTEKWFTAKLTETIHLPGSMAENSKGDDITLDTKWTGSIYDSSWFFQPRLAKYRQPGNIKIPFWLTPSKHYVGVAWYQQDILIPPSWNKKRVTLFLERVHILSQVWIDDKLLGTQNSLSTPHQYELGSSLSPGKHTITIRIDNRIKDMNVGPDSHSVTDHTGGNWNGITGKMSLQAVSQIAVKDIQVYPDITNKTARVKLLLGTAAGKSIKGKLVITAQSFNTTVKQSLQALTKNITVTGDSTLQSIDISLGSQMQLWDEFNPALYRLQVVITDAQGNKEIRQLQFGMRAVTIAGTRIAINGHPVFLRGTVNNCEFPLTGYPPMDSVAWERLFSIAKAHGLNHMRFHSWCPPEAAFAAADKWGFYLQPEAPTWPNHGTSLGDGRFIDQYIYDETNRMVKAYGNHPSFCMLSGGNEPAGRNQATYLAKFIQYWRQKDNRRVYTGASVAMSWPLVPENDYMIKSGSRGLDWNKLPESQSDYRAAIEKFTVPYVTHEMGQWCVFPDFKEITAYTGVYRAKNYELFREDLADHNMADMAEKFFMASGKLQALCYKYEIEKSLRTPGLAGFQLLGLQDFPGQGTALVGVLNAFWKEKEYITAKEFNHFCNATVPLIRTGKFVYTNDEALDAAVELYHFGSKSLNNAIVRWRLLNEKGDILEEHLFPPQNIPVGNCNPAGTIHFSLSKFTNPTKLKLEITIANTSFVNDWDFWVYPAKLPVVQQDDIYYTDTLDTRAEAVLNKGGKVLLLAAGKVVKGKEVIQYFTPVFWNTSWFKMRPPHTTGFVCDATHPAFADFPTSYYSELQWWELVNKTQVMHLEDFPATFKPIVQPIDTWFINRRLAMLFETKAGNGKLMVCSIDLKTDLEKRPVARQLLYSLQKYMLSAKFQPAANVDIKIIKDLFQTPSKLVFNAYTKDSPDELKPQAQQPASKQP